MKQVTSFIFLTKNELMTGDFSNLIFYITVNFYKDEFKTKTSVMYTFKYLRKVKFLYVFWVMFY